MKRLFFLLLAALALSLTACGSQAPAVTQTPETAPAQTAEAAAPAVAGEFYAVQMPWGYNTLFNAGEVLYELQPGTGNCLLYKIDCVTATRQVLCSVPGCSHDSDACPAWLPGQIWDYMVFATEEAVYVYKYRTDWAQTDWDTYRLDYVDPYINDETMRQGMTRQEFETFHRNRFMQLVQPACLYVTQRDGSAQRYIELSENLEKTVNLLWCDGTALYGSRNRGDSQPALGYRVDLATGQVTHFALQPGEGVLAAQGRRLVTRRFVTQMPLPDPQTDGEAYQAALQNSTMECDWLDPATGQREKLLELPGKLFTENSDFCGTAGGQLYFTQRETQPDGSNICTAIRAFHLETGQWEELLNPVPSGQMWLHDPTVVGLPGIAEQAGRYLWFGISDGNGNMRMQILDRTSGTLQETALTPEQVGCQEERGRMPLTDDGRFLLCQGGMRAPYNFDYALIDAEAFLQGSTDYTPVTEA